MPIREAPRRNKYKVPALQRAFGILDILNHSSFGLTVKEVADEQSIPYSTAFYLLETMRECGYAERNDDSKKYRLGHKALSFREGNAARHLLDLRTMARPVMEEITELTGLTTHLAILERGEAVYIEKVESDGFVRLYTWIGKRHSVHCTAVGKALLMCLPENEVRVICQPDTMIRRTERTRTALDVLIPELRQSAERGYAVDDAEDEREGRGIAAAILNNQGQVVASLGVAGSLGQIEVNRIDSIGKLVRNCVGRISQHLGYRQPVPQPTEKVES
jgi:DNA-binding IclR family transcriptional regulator